MPRYCSWLVLFILGTVRVGYCSCRVLWQAGRALRHCSCQVLFHARLMSVAGTVSRALLFMRATVRAAVDARMNSVR
jgi:hypothetical protein